MFMTFKTCLLYYDVAPHCYHSAAKSDFGGVTLEKFQNSCKSLNNLLESQVSDKFKIRLRYKAASPVVESFVNSSKMLENQENVKSILDKGYHVVPLPYIGNYMPPKPDLMFINEQVESTFVDVVSNVASSDVKTVESKHESVDVKNKGVYNTIETKPVRKNIFSPLNIEDWNSDDESEVEFKPKVEVKTVRPSVEKIKFVKAAREKVEKKTIFNKTVNTVRVKDTTATERAVVSENMGKEVNVVKALACWVWKAKHISASNTFKKYSYIDARGKSKSIMAWISKRAYSLIICEGQPTTEGVQGKKVIDSGCSRHITGNKCYLTDYEDYDGRFVSFGDGKGIISGKGKIKTGTLDFDDVYFCKELKYNLFNVSQMCDKKNNVLFTDTECLVLSTNFKLLDESQVLLRVPRKDNIYSVDLKSVVPIGGLTCLFTKAIVDESNLWHRRLRHINYKTMNKLVKGNLARGLPSKIFENDHSCVACQKGKQHKAFYKAKLVNSIRKPLHMLHMDLFSPTNVKSLMKKSYCLVVTDDFKNQLDCKVKVIRCDNGTEFKNSVRNQFCDMKGVKWEFSVAKTPQQNGVAERKNKTLIEAARTMALVIKPHNKTPYELIHGRPLLIDFTKPFGCPVTILNTGDHLVVAGKQTNGIAGTKDNIVAGQAEKKKELEQQYILIPICITDLLISQGPKDNAVDAAKKATEVYESQVLDNGGQDDQVTRSEFERLLQQERQTEHINSTNIFNTVSSPVSTAGPSFANTASPSPINAARTPASTNAFEEYHFERFSPFKNAFSLLHVPIVTLINDTGIFGNVYDDDVVEEKVDMNNMVSSYTIPDAPFTKFLKDQVIDKWAIGTKWVFRNKKDERGIVVKNKARLVAQGHTQEEGIDYDEVFAPVAKIEDIRLFLAYASFKDFVVYQMDVKSAFLYGKIEEDVYVCQPPRFEDPNFPDKDYKVEKALYGLHQAPSAWYETLPTYLMDNGFHRGELSLFLGLKVQQKSDGIFISQDKYVADILKKFDCFIVKTTSTPMEPNKALIKDAESEEVDVHLYRSMIGSLMYLTASRPEITFVVCAYSSFTLEAYSNSDYAGASLDRKSTTGEYVAAANCYGHVLWIQNQMLDYGFNLLNTKIYIDNENETVYKEWEDRMERVATTASSLEAEQDSDAQIRFETASIQSNDPPLSRVNRLGSREDNMKLKKLIELCTKLSNIFWRTAVANTLDIGEVQITATIDRNVKLISEASIRRHIKLEDSDDISTLLNTEIIEQLALIGASKGYTGVDIPLFPTMLVQGLQGKGLTVLVESHHTSSGDPTISQPPLLSPSRVPTPPHDSPLLRRHTPRSDEGSMTLNELTVLRRRVVSTGSGEVSTASRIISTAEEAVSTVGVSMPVSTAKFEPEQTTTKFRERQERDGYEAAIRLQEHQDEENIRARVEADEELTQRLQAEEIEKYNEDDRIKMLVDLINQRKKFFAQQRAEAIRNKPMTQAQQRTYMSNYIKHMGSYTLKQLKKIYFEEIKELFKATMRRIQDFVSMEKKGDKEVSKFAGAKGSKRDVEEELD
nr:hypothetical protein [Tanacetum cinerariifolium]